MKTADHVLLALALSLSVLGLALTLARLRQISTQLAVLTLRVTDLVEAVAELDTDLRAELAMTATLAGSASTTMTE